MKATRILVPVTLAVLLVAALLLLFVVNRNAALQAFRAATRPGTWVATLQNIPGVALTDGGDASLLHSRTGDVAALAGEWKEAEEEYAAAVATDGGVAALKKLAHAQLQRRNIDGARTTLDRLKREGGRAEEILLLSVTLALHENQTARAAELLASGGESPHKHFASALLSLVTGDHVQAQVELAATMEGWDPQLRASARALQDAYDEYALFPASTEIHLLALLSRALAQAQDCPLALPLLRRVTDAQDDYRDAWIVQGYCQLVTEQADAALVSLERAYTLDPQKAETQYFLGRAYAVKDDHGNAVTFFQYALQNGFKPERDVRRALAREARAAGDLQLAFAQEKVLATSSGADLTTIQGFVELALQAEKGEDAYEAAKKATEFWPQNARAYDLLGSAAVALAREDEARAAWQKALELDGSLDDVKEKLLAL